MHLQQYPKEILEASINDMQAQIEKLKEKWQKAKADVKWKLEKKINHIEAQKEIMENELDEIRQNDDITQTSKQMK